MLLTSSRGISTEIKKESLEDLSHPFIPMPHLLNFLSGHPPVAGEWIDGIYQYLDGSVSVVRFIMPKTGAAWHLIS